MKLTRYISVLIVLIVSIALTVWILCWCPREIIEVVDGHPVANTSLGKVSGRMSVSQPGVAEFLGMRYAQAPRWKPAVAVEKWPRPYWAMEYGSACPQNVLGILGIGQEDCLFMNIWAPLKAVNKKPRPVIVWIYGGGFEDGLSQGICLSKTPTQPTLAPFLGRECSFSGAYFAHQNNVVFASFNYRLGALGFARVKDGQKIIAEGNLGIRDQVTALRWLKEHISRFGGDPQNVTIWGESAGAISVLLHLLSIPESENLFKGAIVQSSITTPLFQPEGAEVIGAQFLLNAEKQCQALPGSPKGQQCLNELSPAQIVQAQSSVVFQNQGSKLQPGVQKALTSSAHDEFRQALFRSVFMPWWPFVDGHVVHNQPLEGSTKKPFIIGMDRNEAAVVSMFKGITKCAIDITKKGEIEMYLENAFCPIRGRICDSKRPECPTGPGGEKCIQCRNKVKKIAEKMAVETIFSGKFKSKKIAQWAMAYCFVTRSSPVKWLKCVARKTLEFEASAFNVLTFSNILNDAAVACPARSLAANHGQNTYMYLFDHHPQVSFQPSLIGQLVCGPTSLYPGQSPVCHGSTLPFTFHFTPALHPDEIMLSKRMVGYYGHMVENQKPAPQTWPPAGSDSKTMRLNREEDQVITDPYKKPCETLSPL